MWEKCSKFGIKVHFGDVGLTLPRERDSWLVTTLAKAGFAEEELLRLNKVRLHQQVIFLSCILGVSGKILDNKYLEKRKTDECWSKIKFSVEKPPRKDFLLWKAALRSIVPICGIQDKLGRWLHEGYNIWDWRCDLDSKKLLHLKGGQNGCVHAFKSTRNNKHNQQVGNAQGSSGGPGSRQHLYSQGCWNCCEGSDVHGFSA